MDLYPIVKKNPVLAIFRNIPSEILLDYADAVIEGGISFFEVALNSKDSLAQIRTLRSHCKDNCFIGAGTAITPQLAQAAMEAGAQFLLTPGTPISVLEYCSKHDIPLLPGVYTPGDVAVCLQYGYKTMKLFPAQCVPDNYVKALKGPFDDTNYVAIGGVTMDNISDFLKKGYSGAGLSSNLMPKEILKARDWAAGAAYIKNCLSKLNPSYTVKGGY